MPPTAPRPIQQMPGQPQPPYGYPSQPPAYGAGQTQPYPPYQQQQPQPWGGQPAPQRYPTVPYGTAPQYVGAAPEKKSSMLGIIGFAVVVLSTLVAIVLAAGSGPAFSQYLAIFPPNATQEQIQQILNSMTPAEQQALGSAFVGPLLGVTVASIAGFIGWIVSIVATATARGRGWGIAGIILGVLAPVAIFFAMMAAIVGALS